ncbi:MAG: ABC transporter ATP-binding protein [Candidatus Methanomethylicia archaeon]
MLKIENLTKRFGGLIALNNVNLNIEKGEIRGLIGPNGSGKTTLFNCITGFHHPETGRIIFEGEDITGLPPHKIAIKGIARTFQIVKAFHKMTVYESILTGALLRAKDIKEAREITLEIMEFTGLIKRRDTLAGNLTTIDRKKLGLASAIATKPKLLLLDELVAGLTPGEINEIIKLIRDIRENGVTMIIVEHVMKFIMEIADKITVLHRGEIIGEGKPEEIAGNPKVIEAYLGEKYA